MLLRNYDNLMAAKRLCALVSGTGSTDTSVFGDGHINLKNSSGTIKAIYLPSASSNTGQMVPLHLFDLLSNAYNTHSQSYNNLICGSGTTKETYDDYKLESLLETTKVIPVSHKVSSVVYDEDTKVYSRTYTKVCCALEPIEVSEIGVCAPIMATSSSTSTSAILFYRKVLDAPISVPADTNFIISLTTFVSANPNKPANYEATVSVE